ncbi:hypothetical protein HaLaN_23208, partial [Haematococcus lacustris]
MLRQLKEFFYNQLQRQLVRPRQHRHPMLMPVSEDPNIQALQAKLQGLGTSPEGSELQAGTLDKGHVADLIEEADKHRRLLGMKKQGVEVHFTMLD